eukprot:gene53869-42335_t
MPLFAKREERATAADARTQLISASCDARYVSAVIEGGLHHDSRVTDRVRYGTWRHCSVIVKRACATEIRALSALRHPHILEAVLSNVEDGEEEDTSASRQRLAYMHSKSVTHGAIRASNVFVDACGTHCRLGSLSRCDLRALELAAAARVAGADAGCPKSPAAHLLSPTAGD